MPVTANLEDIFIVWGYNTEAIRKLARRIGTWLEGFCESVDGRDEEEAKV